MKTRLELAGVTKAFGRHQVLTQTWLQARAGEAMGLIGANGAGKTTMLRIAAGLGVPIVDSPMVRGARRPAGEDSLLRRRDDAASSVSRGGGRRSSASRRTSGALSPFVEGTRQLLGLRVVLSVKGGLACSTSRGSADPEAARG